MEKTEFYYPSGDGHTEIHAIEWRGEDRLKLSFKSVMEW